jgi:tetratricopeptide (TPR) repeat protein
VIEPLKQSGLLREDQRGEAQYIELSHDRLVRPLLESAKLRKAEELVKHEYENELKVARENATKSEKRKKAVKQRIYIGLGILLAVLLVFIWYKGRKDRELEIQYVYTSVEKSNPTLAYNIARVGSAQGFSSFKKLQEKLEEKNYGYITTAFVVPGDIVAAYIAGKNQVIVVSSSEIMYFNRSGLIDSARSLPGTIYASTFDDGEGLLLFQTKTNLNGFSSDSLQLRNFNGDVLLQWNATVPDHNVSMIKSGQYIIAGKDQLNKDSNSGKWQLKKRLTDADNVSAIGYLSNGEIVKAFKSGAVTRGKNTVHQGDVLINEMYGINDSIFLVRGQNHNIFININDSVGVEKGRGNAASNKAYVGKVEEAFAGLVTAVGVSSAGKVIFGSDDRRARIYGIEGKKTAILKGHTSKVISANFAADGKEVVTAASNGEVFVWSTLKPSTLARNGQLLQLSSLDYQIYKLDNNRSNDKSSSGVDRLKHLVNDHVSYVRQIYTDPEESEYDASIIDAVAKQFETIIKPPYGMQVSNFQKKLLFENYAKVFDFRLEKTDKEQTELYNGLLDKRDSINIAIILFDTADIEKALQFNYLFNYYITALEKAKDYAQILRYCDKKISLLETFDIKHPGNKSIRNELVNNYGAKSYYLIFNRRFHDAIQTAKHGLSLDSAYQWINTNLALGYLLTGKYEEALVLYKRYGSRSRKNEHDDLRVGFLQDFKTFEDMGIITTEDTELWKQVSYIKQNILQ